MGRNSNRLGGNNEGQIQHNRNDKARRQGELLQPDGKPLQLRGLRTSAPMLEGGTAMHSVGDWAVADGKDSKVYNVQLYDGVARFIDRTVWEEETDSIIEYEKQILKMARSFILGGDELAQKYLGPWYKYLLPDTAGGWTRASFDKYANKSSIDARSFTSGVSGNTIYNCNATPSFMRGMSELSDTYPLCLLKLKLVILWAGFVFEGKPLKQLPQVPDMDVINNRTAQPHDAGDRPSIRVQSNEDALRQQ